MSRVHDALRRAGLESGPAATGPAATKDDRESARGSFLSSNQFSSNQGTGGGAALLYREPPAPGVLDGVVEIPFRRAPDSHLLDVENLHAQPGEEFRTLRTRLNHLQSQQRLKSVVVSSPSPAEGKSFTASNLALAQAQLKDQRVFLGDFDLRRPMLHQRFETDRAPGASDYILGQATLAQALRKIAGLNLYFMPAGTPVKNPLELLNLREAKNLFEELPEIFDWAIFDTPPLLFSADANLMATMADGTVLVVRIGETTFDNIARASQSLCENNMLGIVVNGARASELYSKYTYYYSKPE
jgi:protein-tyrosine kinase